MKRRSNFKFALIPIIVALIGSLLPNAFSAWAGGNEHTISVSKTTLNNSPCYIYENNIEYNFPTIESAVGEANKKGGGHIYIRPGTASSPKTPTINKDITLKDGVALILPYNGRQFDIGNENFVNSGSNDFATSSKKVTSLRLANGKKIELEGGSIIIGGIVGGSSNSGLLSATTSTHCELVLGIGSQIVCNKPSTVKFENEDSARHSIESWGYIRRSSSSTDQDDAKVILNQGSLLCPFVIYDMKGASNTSNMIGNTFPFSIFDFPNLEIKTVFNYGSELYSIFRITIDGKLGFGSYTGGQQVKVIGESGCLFRLKDSTSSIQLSYNPAVYATPTTDHALSHLTTTIELFGNISLDNIQVQVSAATVNSADYLLPLSYRLNIITKSGSNITINNNIKFMSGVKFLAEPNSFLEIVNKDVEIIIFSKDYTSINNTSSEYVASFQYPYGLFPKGADFILNGKAKIKGKVAGFINTTHEGSILNLTESALSPITSKEYYAFKDGLLTNTAQYKDIVEETLSGNAFFSGEITEASFFSYEFHSAKLNNSTFYWVFPDNFVNKPVLTTANTEISSGGAENVEITASCSSWSPPTSNIIYTLYKSSGSSTYTIASDPITTNNKEHTFKVSFGSVESTTSTYYKVRVALSVDGNVYSESETLQFKQTVGEGGGGPCLIGTSKVLLSNGQTKFAENLTKGDKILAFDHSSGKFVSREIIFNAYSSKELFEVIKLTFDNGNILQIATGHGLFNVDRNTYEIYYGREFYNHIGETFLAVSYNSKMPVLEKTKLIDVEIKQQYTCKYTPLSEYDINCIADGMLTIPDDIEGMFDSFFYNEDFTYDLVALQEDIDKYGVYTYEDVKDVVHPYVFEVFNFKYWKAFIGKGTLSYEKVNHWISAYMDQIVAFNNLDWDTSKQVPLGPQHG